MIPPSLGTWSSLSCNWLPTTRSYGRIIGETPVAVSYTSERAQALLRFPSTYCNVHPSYNFLSTLDHSASSCDLIPLLASYDHVRRKWLRRAGRYQ